MGRSAQVFGFEVSLPKRLLRESKGELKIEPGFDFWGLRPDSVDDGDSFRLRVGAGEGEVGSSVKAGLRARALFARAGIDDSLAFGVWAGPLGGAGLSSVVALVPGCLDKAAAFSRVRAFVALFISKALSELVA